MLAKWLMEHDSEARVLVVTDRDELDKQIEGVMKNAGVIGENSPSPRVTKRAEFVAKLGDTLPRLICALIHKFDPADLKGEPPLVHGRFYVFVDECHRTQDGNMNTQMKRWLPHAIFIGFGVGTFELWMECLVAFAWQAGESLVDLDEWISLAEVGVVVVSWHP